MPVHKVEESKFDCVLSGQAYLQSLNLFNGTLLALQLQLQPGNLLLRGLKMQSTYKPVMPMPL